MLSKIVSAISRQCKHRKYERFLSSVKCSECLPSPWKYSCQTVFTTWDSFVNWTCGKLSHNFSSATFNSETVFGFGRPLSVVCRQC